MINRLLAHARAHAIAYAALILSILGLCGGAYAALSLPANSVGAAQIRNGSINPVKFNPTAIGGAVRHWVRVTADGTIVAASSRARDTGIARDGSYLITWSDTLPPKCIPLATVIGRAGLLQPAQGFANATITGRHPTRVWVSTYDPQGDAKPLGFSLAVVC
jgi:hypothetical protein